MAPVTCGYVAVSNYKRGDKVAIISTLRGRFLVESRAAKVVRHYGDEYYIVKIDHEEVLRFVNQAAQDDPEGFVGALNAQGNPEQFNSFVQVRQI